MPGFFNTIAVCQYITAFSSHLNAGEGIFALAFTLWATKKYHQGIAGKLVCGPAVFDGNIGHFGKVIVDQCCQKFGFERNAEICKADNTGEKKRSGFSAAGNAVKDLR